MNQFLAKEFKTGCALTLINVPIGIVLSYLALAVFLQSTDDAFAFMAFSIICTAGISLILWLPIWYFLGYAVVLPVRLIWTGYRLNQAEAQAAPASPTEPQAGLSKDELALVAYVKKATAKGLSAEQIRANLSSHGWPAENITAAFKLVKSGV